MDERHVNIIHNIVMDNNFKTIVEIGSYMGYSTCALLAALDKGKQFNLHLVEPWQYRPEETSNLDEAIDWCTNKEAIKIHNLQSDAFWSSACPKDIDLVIIDGDHHIPNAATDFFHALKNDIPNIISHDSNPPLDKEWGKSCYGSKIIADILKSHKDFKSLEDKESRAGERTYRGLLYATKKDVEFQRAERIFDELC
tara:strand:+ start:321 stop:911 length:591 start_codon:yes stop_codon:yes gene_type:complete